MRIISQDGTIDFRYENFALAMTEDNYIIAVRDTIARPDEIAKGVVAKYSTKEKAQKAMEMLRTAFNNYDWIKRTGNSEETQNALKVVSNEQYKEMTSSCFQFPADEELEV